MLRSVYKSLASNVFGILLSTPCIVPKFSRFNATSMSRQFCSDSVLPEEHTRRGIWGVWRLETGQGNGESHVVLPGISPEDPSRLLLA
jgi:hypothetical protein